MGSQGFISGNEAEAAGEQAAGFLPPLPAGVGVGVGTEALDSGKSSGSAPRSGHLVDLAITPIRPSRPHEAIS